MAIDRIIGGLGVGVEVGVLAMDEEEGRRGTETKRKRRRGGERRGEVCSFFTSSPSFFSLPVLRGYHS